MGRDPGVHHAPVLPHHGARAHAPPGSRRPAICAASGSAFPSTNRPARRLGTRDSRRRVRRAAAATSSGSWSARPEKSHGGSTGFTPPPGVRSRYIPPSTDIGEMLLAASSTRRCSIYRERNLVDRSHDRSARPAPSIRPLFPDPAAEAGATTRRPGSSRSTTASSCAASCSNALAVDRIEPSTTRSSRRRSWRAESASERSKGTSSSACSTGRSHRRSRPIRTRTDCARRVWYSRRSRRRSSTKV